MNTYKRLRGIDGPANGEDELQSLLINDEAVMRKKVDIRRKKGQGKQSACSRCGETVKKESNGGGSREVHFLHTDTSSSLHRISRLPPFHGVDLAYLDHRLRNRNGKSSNHTGGV